MAIASLGLAATQAKEPAQSSPDEQMIRKSVDDYCAAYNKGDLDALMSYWAKDAEYVDDDGETHRGRDAIGAIFKNSLEKLKGFTLHLKIDDLRFVKPEVAIEDGTATLTGPDGETSSGRYTAVWTKSGDRWLIDNDHDLPSNEKPAEVANADYLKPLDWLVGDWTSEDKGQTVNLSVKWALDKNFLVHDYTVAGEAGADLRVTQWIGFDPVTGQIKSWTFDSRGGYGSGLWTREDNTWRADTTGVLPDGRIGGALNSIHFVDDSHLEWESTGRNVDGQPMPDARVKFVRSNKTEKSDKR
jgi:uncharacterized protein (TIGR02246 family)